MQQLLSIKKNDSNATTLIMLIHI